MSDQDREAWGQNDEGLCRFVREHRATLEAIIAKVMSGESQRIFWNTEVSPWRNELRISKRSSEE